MKLNITISFFLLAFIGLALPNIAFSQLNKKLDINWNIHLEGDCKSCHPEPTLKRSEIKNTNFTPFCQSCHSTHKFSHTNNPGKVKFPKKFPLSNKKKIGCITCHNEPRCHHELPPSYKMLRGGAFSTTKDFCNQCHNKSEQTRKKLSPHEYNIEKPSLCISCHTNSNENKIKKSSDNFLRKKAYEICQDCHKFETHYLMKEHMGSRVIQSKEVNNLPLTPNNTIYCGTCHLPHLKTIPGKEKINTRKSTKDGSLCLSCHKFGDM